MARSIAQTLVHLAYKIILSNFQEKENSNALFKSFYEAEIFAKHIDSFCKTSITLVLKSCGY